MENGLIYDRPIEKKIENLNVEHKRVLSFVKDNSTVLEIGCHTGYFSYWLKKKGCIVFGTDIFEPALDKAKPHLDDFFLGNVESDEFMKSLKNKCFDTIIIMHVLEHLVNPYILLEKLTKHLTDRGNIIIALPNISNWNSRIDILKGNFAYQDSGLMDRTHLRFFNYYTTKELIQNSGLEIINFVGFGKVNFHIFPNIKFIWRGNKISSILFQILFRNKPNIVHQSLLFNTAKKIQ